MMWTLVSIFAIAPLGALAFDRPTFGNWIWHIDPDKPRDHKWVYPKWTHGRRVAALAALALHTPLAQLN